MAAAAAGVVHHWNGSLDSIAALWLQEERVPTDGTRTLKNTPTFGFLWAQEDNEAVLAGTNRKKLKIGCYVKKKL